ncbi:NrfD/PsrC family molybdoenzyme membrane anchor subunit [Thermosyntropha sp.]|uniref:NrfD/PsrC family molybdoenzyme membrane anchor subunit n=1 Tax=Thermosyntropha sp. TaxID=2740820 RepID=UPI0025FCEBC9|nr:NrfD/PsrC family molybdoenzyme membrane anchor subunit [Thermosyntropha sp.]MBO8159222.1 polysulfide reductase NrfD [Thermosyntropha sp.]
MEHHFTWNYLIAIYLFTAGISSGAGIVAAVGYVVNGMDERLKRVAAYFAPFPVLLGLLCLILDLHRPWNFYKVLIHYNITSVMSWGAFFLLVFPMVAFIFAAMVYWNIDNVWRRIFAWLELIFGIAIGVYAGLLLAAIYNNPVWSNPLIAFLFFISALSTGICSLMLIGKVWDKIEDFVRKFLPSNWQPERILLTFDHKLLKRILIVDAVFIVVELMVISTLLISYALRPTGQVALGAIITGGYYLLFWIGVVLFGLTIPLILGIMEVGDKIKGGMAGIVPWAEPIMVLIGGFILRYVIVYGGQIVYPILTYYP